MDHWVVCRRLAISIVLIASAVSCSDDGDGPTVVTDDGIYINELYASGEDWIELFNSTNSEQNIGGFLIYDDAAKKYPLPSNTIIPARGFLVLICDDTGTGLHTNFKLTSDGETVSLENANGALIDKVDFPALSEGQSYARFPDGESTFAISGATTKGLTNGASNAPAITGTSREPLIPQTTDAVTIQTKLASNEGIASAKLFYRIGGSAFTAVSMALTGGNYEGTIPAQNSTGTVEYYVEIKNTSNQATVSPSSAPSTNYSYLLNTDVLPKLYVNEFMAANTACCPDTESGTDEFDDWVEIYNGGPGAVNIGGMYMSDDKSDPFKYKIPSDNAPATTIAAGGRLVLWADGSISQGTLHLDFSLSNSGEDIGIYYKDGRTIDNFTFGTQVDNQSTGRSPDGANNWTLFANPSPGSSNN